jgi:hypothetical protein
MGKKKKYLIDSKLLDGNVHHFASREVTNQITNSLFSDNSLGLMKKKS